jgi:hypothetical protein
VGIAHFVLANLAFVAEIADSTGLKGNPVPKFQVGYFCANFVRNVRWHYTMKVKMSDLEKLSPRTRDREPEDESVCWKTIFKGDGLWYHRLLDNERADSTVFIEMNL